MKAIAFDTLEFAKKLKAAQFTAEQAETLAAAMAEIIDSPLSTKEDIALLQRDMKELELRLKHDLTLRLGGMLAAAVAIVAAMVKLL